MRICLISGEFPPMQGGVSDYTQEIGAALADLGHAVTVFTAARAAGLAQRRGCRVFAEQADWGWGLWRRAGAFFAAQRPDIVNIQYQTAAYAMRPAINFLPWRMGRAGAARPRFVVTFHDLLIPFLFRGAGPLRPWVTSWLARTADGVIATNEEDDADLAVRAARTPRRLIPIGSNISGRLPAGYDRAAWRARWGIGPEETALVYFGFLNQSKGGEELITALARLRDAGRAVRLLMVGGKVGASDPTNRAYLARVEALIAASDIGSRIVWTDYLPAEEVSATLRAADIAVQPYRDGVSTRRGALLAALTHAMPIVTTQPRVPSAHFRDGENMLLTPAGDAAALAAAIVRLADAPALRERLGAGAAALAARFTWPAIAASTAAFFDALLAGRRVTRE